MKKNNFNILFFLLIFFTFYFGFNTLVGVCMPGGKLYSSFAATYLNVPYWLSILITQSAKFILECLGYSVYQKIPSNITIAHGRGVNIGWGCIGAGVISFWVAFITAHKIVLRKKLIWLISGVFFIFFLNIVRVVSIALALHYKWKFFLSFDAHGTFNFFSYLIIFVLMWYFINWYKKYNLNYRTNRGE